MKVIQRFRMKPRTMSPISLLKTGTNSLSFSEMIHPKNCEKSNDNNSIIQQQTSLTQTQQTMLYGAVAAAMVTTQAGYTLSPLMVTCMSNAPLLAFAYVQASGLSPIRQIMKDQQTGDLSPFPFVSLYTNCAIWSLYGVLNGDQTIIIANFAGCVVGAAYTAYFAKYTDQAMSKYYFGSAGILGVFLSSPFWAESLGMNAADVLGTFGMSTAVVLMASPLVVVKTVIAQKSTAAMPFPVSLAMTLNGAAWGTYGWFVQDDAYIWIPNILGCASGLVQMSLFAIYGFA